MLNKILTESEIFASKVDPSAAGNDHVFLQRGGGTVVSRGPAGLSTPLPSHGKIKIL
jgi:hypothetical protein